MSECRHISVGINQTQHTHSHSHNKTLRARMWHHFSEEPRSISYAAPHMPRKSLIQMSKELHKANNMLIYGADVGKEGGGRVNER
jgi:deoxycytidylate deaminase